MTRNIDYAVIALTEDDVEDVISSLDSRGLTQLSQWLTEHKDKIYGNLPDNWKPFGDQTISDIIKDESDCYICETSTISQLNDDCMNSGTIRHIDVFFIDIFAMYIQKYKNLALRVDHSFMDASDSKCCFVINYTLPADYQEELEKECISNWSEVFDGYEKGFLHRVVARVNDLKNFKNFIKLSLENKDRMSPRANIAMLNNPTTHDIVTNDGNMPNLGGG